MQRRTVIASIGAILGTSVGAAAYTNATVTRATSFTVATDATSALIGLTAGTTDRVTETSGALDISIANLNTDGTFTYGDTESLDTAYAFSITNNDSTERTITVGYDTVGVTFELFEEGGTDDWAGATSLGVVNDTDTVDLTANAGQEFRAVMTVDTTGVGSTSEELNGELSFTAN